jgi:hypothetical protein
MISQYFTNPTPLVGVLNRFRHGFALVKLCTHFLAQGLALLRLAATGRPAQFALTGKK